MMYEIMAATTVSPSAVKGFGMILLIIGVIGLLSSIFGKKK